LSFVTKGGFSAPGNMQRGKFQSGAGSSVSRKRPGTAKPLPGQWVQGGSEHPFAMIPPYPQGFLCATAHRPACKKALQTARAYFAILVPDTWMKT